MADTMLVLALLLGVGFVATRLASLARLPHSVFLVLIGITSGMVLKVVHRELPPNLLERFPDIVLYALLPPLVFEAAHNINIDDLRRDLKVVAALAVVALLISAALVGVGLHAALGVSLMAGLLFGALISATDPVAVVALFREVGAPRRLAVLVEGESLLNDATAIVLFRVVLALMAVPATGTHPAVTGAIQFAVVAVGGILVGAAFIVVTSQLLRAVRNSGPAQMGLTVTCAYASFLVADHVCHVSGVMATMTVGLYLGNQARLQYNREALNGMHALWEFLALAANTLVFLAVGLAVDLDLLWRAASAIPVTLAVVYASRAVSVVACVWPLAALRLIPPLPRGYQAVLIWGGLRGGLALALVLLLPGDFPHRQLFLALGTAVVLATLIINALTTLPLMRLLKLDTLDRAQRIFLSRSLSAALERVFDRLQQAVKGGKLSAQLVEELKTTALPPFADGAADEQDTVAFDVERLLLTEQQYYNARLEEGTLSADAYRLLRTTVTERLEAYRREGVAALMAYPFRLEARRRRLERFTGDGQLARLTVTLEALLHLGMGFEAAAEVASDDTTRGLIRAWKIRAGGLVDIFQRSHPQLDVAVQSGFVAGAVAASAQAVLEELHQAEIIGGMVHRHASLRVEALHRSLLRETVRRLHPTVVELLAAAPLFSRLPQEALVTLRDAIVRQTIPAGVAVVREGESGTSLFLVLSGILEVRGGPFESTENRPRFFAGSFFGEMSLVFGTPRAADVVAVVDSELAEIRQDVFRIMAATYPELREEVESMAAARRAQNQEAAHPTVPSA